VGRELNTVEILLVVIVIAFGVLIYLLYSGVMALCDEIIAARIAVLAQLEKIEQHLSVGFAKETEEYHRDLLARWADLKSAMNDAVPNEDPNPKLPG